MSSKRVTRRSAVALLGLAGLSIPALLHGQPQPARGDDQQPHMQLALDALKTAKHHLDEAIADKGGHRAKALELVNSAISETQAGIAYAASH